MHKLQVVNTWDNHKELTLILDKGVYDLIVNQKLRISFIGQKHNPYARIRVNGEMLMLHKYVCPAPEGMITEHKNGNPLDNRRSNLRIASVSQNRANSKKATSSKKIMTSLYKGVHKKSALRNWSASICFNRQRYHLGSFKNEEEAARAYDLKAKELFGEFAKLNFKQN